VPAVLFAVFAAATVFVASRQVVLNRSLLARHTEDVCLQATRRLNVFIESRLAVVQVFADRWSSHEQRDFSRRRFEEFGQVVVEALPGTRAMGLVPPDRGVAWVVPRGADVSEQHLGPELLRVLDEARERGDTVLSAPIELRGERTVVIAALPLQRGEEDLGSLVVEFQAESLIDASFDERIKQEFAFDVHDGDDLLYRYPREVTVFEGEPPPVSARERFAVRNRTWMLTMVPRSTAVATSGWMSALPVLVLGLLLSLSLAALAHVAMRRLQLYRRARDHALSEMSARAKAQRALAVSEARYRSVFDSATDGLIVMEPSGTIVEANVAACEMHGRRYGELAGSAYPALIAPDRRHLWDDLREQIEKAGTVRLESVHVTSSGDRVSLEVRGTAFAHGEAPRILVILTDVTELRRSEQRHTALSRKVLVAQEEERARISRELHDELGQVLTAIRFELGWIGKRLSRELGGSESVLSTVVPLVEKAAVDLRHICRGLRPPLLDDLGLEPAAQLLAREFEERTGIKVDVEVDIDESDEAIPMEVALAAYRVLQESLTNVGRHAEAEHVSMSLVLEPSSLVASVYDDGRGFEIDELSPGASSGLVGMRERAFLVGGTVEVRSSPFQGTRVTLRVPLRGKAHLMEAP
jgi:PAS domain S-box-containing protein